METKSLGHAMNVRFELESPIKMTIDSMDLGSIVLMVGKNGTGKTLINKLVFFTTFVTFLELTEKSNPALAKAFERDARLSSNMDRATYLFQNTFSDPKEFTGHIVTHFENGSLECDVKEGEICNLMTSYDANVTDGTYPKYMSISTRLFSQMEAILMMDKMLPNEGVLVHYRLYDVMHCHRIRQFAQEVSTISEDLVKLLKEGYDTDIVSLSYDENNCQFSFVDSTGKQRLVSSLGAGHQSIINIMLGVRV